VAAGIWDAYVLKKYRSNCNFKDIMNKKKTLVIINGPMGIGKTVVSDSLYKKFNKSVWLDGDWCWMMNPWMINDDNRKMVENNICHVLRNYLMNPCFDFVIFSWVIHKNEILNTILNCIKDLVFKLYKFTLVCDKDVLRKRLENDGRNENVIEESIKRLDYYDKIDSIKIDTSSQTVNEITEEIIKLIK
jgi:broad-specificity NMP kinase